MFDENYFGKVGTAAARADSESAEGPAAWGRAEEDVAFDKYRSSGDTNTDDRGRGSSAVANGRPRQSHPLQRDSHADPVGVDAPPLSETPGYEGMPTEDAIVSSLATRQSGQRRLSSPREEFRRTNYGATGSGQLHPLPSPTSAAALRIAETPATSTTGLAPSPSDNLPPPTSAHHTSYFERDDGTMNEQRLRVPQLPLARLEESRTQDGDTAPPREASAPPPSYTPRTGGRANTARGAAATPVTSRHHVASSNERGGSGDDGESEGRGTKDYSQVRSVLADYMNGHISALEARHGAMRAVSPGRDTQHSARRSFSAARARTPSATPKARALSLRTSSPAPQSASRIQRGQATPQHADNPVSGRGAPRCASIIPERKKYVPPEVVAKPSEEEVERQQRAAAEAEEAKERKRRHDARVAAQRAAARVGSPRPPPRTPISYREGDAPEDRKRAASRSHSKRKARSANAKRAGSPQADKPARRTAAELQSRTVFAPESSSSAPGGKPTGKKSREVNPFGYRKMLVFPTTAPTVTLPEPAAQSKLPIIIKKLPSKYATGS